MQLIARRANKSVEQLATLQRELKASSEDLKTNSVWPEISWIVTNEGHSLDSKLTSYLGQMRALFNQNDNNAIVSVPQIPIEAAGARYGALFLGYEKASVQLKQLIADNSSRVDLVHKVLTAFIIVVMLLISAVVVAPLWLRLISELKRLQPGRCNFYGRLG